MVNSATFLLAAYSLFEIGSLAGNFLFLYLAFSGKYFIGFETGVRILFPAHVSAGCAVLLLPIIGIDRLFYVIFPMR
jgi:hypothetical protein